MNYQRIYDQLIAKRKERPVCKPEYFEKHHIKPRALGGSDEKSNIARLTAREHFIAHLLLAKIHGGSMWVAAHYMMNPESKSGKGVRIGSRTYQTIKENHSKHKSEFFRGENNHWFGKSIPWEHVKKMKGPRPSVSGSNNPNFGRDMSKTRLIISHVKSYKPLQVSVDYTVMNRVNDMLNIRMTTAGKDMLSHEIDKLRRHIMFKYLDRGDITGSKNPNFGNGQAISGDKNPMFGKKHEASTKLKIAEKAKRRISCPHCGKDGNIANMYRWHFDNCRFKVAA